MHLNKVPMEPGTLEKKGLAPWVSTLPANVPHCSTFKTCMEATGMKQFKPTIWGSETDTEVKAACLVCTQTELDLQVHHTTPSTTGQILQRTSTPASEHTRRDPWANWSSLILSRC